MGRAGESVRERVGINSSKAVERRREEDELVEHKFAVVCVDGREGFEIVGLFRERNWRTIHLLNKRRSERRKRRRRG